MYNHIILGHSLFETKCMENFCALQNHFVTFTPENTQVLCLRHEVHKYPSGKFKRYIFRYTYLYTILYTTFNAFCFKGTMDSAVSSKSNLHQSSFPTLTVGVEENGILMSSSLCIYNTWHIVQAYISVRNCFYYAFLRL